MPDGRVESAEVKDVLARDKWHCTATVMPRTITTGLGTFTIPKQPTRCPVMGSEMVVVNGKTLCPRHARLLRGGSR